MISTTDSRINLFWHADKKKKETVPIVQLSNYLCFHQNMSEVMYFPMWLTQEKHQGCIRLILYENESALKMIYLRQNLKKYQAGEPQC